MKKLILGSAVALMMAAPFSASAAVYEYVSYTGEVKHIDAPYPIAALILAFDIAFNSGVMRLDDETESLPAYTIMPGASIVAAHVQQ